MTWILRFLFFFFLFLLIGRALKWLTGSAGTRNATRKARRDEAGTRTVTGQTVKDPQCGTYVARAIAVTGDEGGTTRYFCSDECRDEYLARKRVTEEEQHSSLRY